MKKILIGLLLVAVALPGAAQSRRSRGGGQAAPRSSGVSHAAPRSSGFSHAAARTSGGFTRPAARPTNSYTRSSSGYSRSNTRSGFAGSYGRSGSATRSSTFGLRRSPGYRAIGGHGGGNIRPTGIGHPRDWFAGRGWHPGPSFIAPIFSCYPGFTWNEMPSLYDVVWVYDPTTGQYYEAYYYPEYGYYAWASNPLVAVGVYTPSMAFEVG